VRAQAIRSLCGGLPEPNQHLPPYSSTNVGALSLHACAEQQHSPGAEYGCALHISRRLASSARTGRRVALLSLLMRRRQGTWRELFATFVTAYEVVWQIAGWLPSVIVGAKSSPPNANESAGIIRRPRMGDQSLNDELIVRLCRWSWLAES
jgi:hypothetical protein